MVPLSQESISLGGQHRHESSILWAFNYMFKVTATEDVRWSIRSSSWTAPSHTLRFGRFLQRGLGRTTTMKIANNHVKFLHDRFHYPGVNEAGLHGIPCLTFAASQLQSGARVAIARYHRLTMEFVKLVAREPWRFHRWHDYMHGIGSLQGHMGPQRRRHSLVDKVIIRAASYITSTVLWCSGTLIKASAPTSEKPRDRRTYRSVASREGSLRIPPIIHVCWGKQGCFFDGIVPLW